MRLSKRIYKIADKVQKGETAADIGTDHGYVPMLLIKNGVSPRTVMSDISSGSLSKAYDTFELAGLNAAPEDFRVGDGLETICPGEVDDIIIGGLGGFTIIGILSDDIAKSRSFRKLILQPRKHSGNLRFFLYTHGWDIIDEDIAPEGKFVCEIIIYANDRAGLLNDVTRNFSERDINILKVNTMTSKHGIATLTISFEVTSVEELREICGKLLNIRGVQAVKRTNG